MGHSIKIFGKSIAITRPDWVECITGKAPEAEQPKKRLPVDTVKRLRQMAAWEREMHSTAAGIFIALYLKNPLNSRRNWRPVAKDARLARLSTAQACIVKGIEKRFPVKVVMTMYGRGKRDDGCGLNASLKPIRDGIADYFGRKDNDPAYEWDYAAQKPAPIGCHGIQVEFIYQGDK